MKDARSSHEPEENSDSEATSAPIVIDPKAVSDSLAPPLPRMGRFEIRHKLGEGAFGIVYLAYDATLDRHVALKVPKVSVDRPDLEERFLAEARAAARLRHPNIVTVHDCGRHGERFYIAFEYIDGPTLAQRLAQERPSPVQAARWVRDLALALQYAHDQGVLHRDVKPANILIDTQDRMRLADFGLSHTSGGTVDVTSSDVDATIGLTRDGTILGTPAYMAPEQARGEISRIGPATDQYSLGVVLYEMLVGRRPYEGTVAEILAQVAANDVEALPPSSFGPSVPPVLGAIARRTLAKSVAMRYASLGELAVDLQRWLKGDRLTMPGPVASGGFVATGGFGLPSKSAPAPQICPVCEATLPPGSALCLRCGHGTAKFIPANRRPVSNHKIATAEQNLLAQKSNPLLAIVQSKAAVEAPIPWPLKVVGILYFLGSILTIVIFLAIQLRLFANDQANGTTDARALMLPGILGLGGMVVLGQLGFALRRGRRGAFFGSLVFLAMCCVGLVWAVATLQAGAPESWLIVPGFAVMAMCCLPLIAIGGVFWKSLR